MESVYLGWGKYLCGSEKTGDAFRLIWEYQSFFLAEGEGSIFRGQPSGLINLEMISIESPVKARFFQARILSF